MMRILHVEDNPADIDLVGDLLEESGAEVDIKLARSMDEARGCLCFDEVLPEVILLDVGLPDSQGDDSLRSMVALAGDLPVVVVTGVEDEQLGLLAVELGAEDYLLKIEIAAEGVLLRTLRYAIGRASRRRKAMREAIEVGINVADLTSDDAPSVGSEACSTAAGREPFRRRSPEEFERLTKLHLLSIERLLGLPQRISADAVIGVGDSDHLIRRLVANDADVADLIELHSHAMRVFQTTAGQPFARSALAELRNMLVVLMGRLTAGRASSGHSGDQPSRDPTPLRP